MTKTSNVAIRKIIIGVVIAFNLIMCMLLAVQPREKSNDAITIAAFVMVLAAIIGFRELKRDNIPKMQSKQIIASVLMTILFLTQLSVSEIMNSTLFSENRTVLYKVFLLGVILALFVGILLIISGIIRACCAADIDSSPRSGAMCDNRICMAVITIESLLFLASAYPAIDIGSDIEYVFGCAMNNIWTDWHTIGYLLFVELCTYIYESPFTVIVVQTIIWLILHKYMLDMLKTVSNKAALVYTIIVALSATPFLYLEHMVKDTVFSIGMLALTVVLFKVIHTNCITWKDTLCLTTISVFALLCRHGGVVPVLLTEIVTLIYFTRKDKKQLKITYHLLFTILVHCIIYFFVYGVLMYELVASVNPTYVKYGTPMAMISGAVAAGVEFDEEDIEILEKVMPIEKWGECYNPYWADDVSRVWGKVGEDILVVHELIAFDGYGMDLLKINAKIFLQHPRLYLRCFFDMNSIIWEMSRPEDVELNIVSGIPEDENIHYTAAYNLTHPFTQFMNSYPITSAMTTRGGFSLFTLLLCLVIFALSGRKRYIISMLPILMVNGMLFLTVPAQYPRYVVPTIMCAIFFATIVITQRDKE